MNTQDRSNPTRDCIELIRSLLCMPDFGLNCSSDRDLCELLLDGQILCSIVAALDMQQGPGTQQENVQHASSFYSFNSQLLVKKNIRYFLSHCEEVFGIDRSLLFEPSDLLALKDPRKVVTVVHSLLVGALRTQQESVRVERMSKLTYVVQEICRHEKLLIDKLNKLMAFREQLGYLSRWSDDLVHTVFEHTQPLLSVHCEFYAKLTSLADRGSTHFCRHLGSALDDVKAKLETVYLMFFRRLPVAHARMESEFAKSPALRDQLQRLESVICESNPFRLLYDAPIRQLTNYPLLIDRLSKETTKEAPDVKSFVDEALGVARLLVERTNERQQQAEHVDATVEVLARIVSLPVDLSKPAEVGLHLVGAPFNVRRYQGGNESRRGLGYCVLTTKQLLVASKAGKRQPLRYWFSVPIACSMQFRRLDASSLEIFLPDMGEKLKLQSRKGHLLNADQWIELLCQARATCFPNGWNANFHRFELVSCFPDGGAVALRCSTCNQDLTGSAVPQSYACRRCERRLDAECMRRRPPGICRITALDYYHPGLDRDGAVRLLDDKAPGSFLIRDGGSGGAAAGQRVLSIRIRDTEMPIVHTRILTDKAGQMTLEINPKFKFNSLDLLIAHYCSVNLSAQYGQLARPLTNGIEPLVRD